MAVTEAAPAAVPARTTGSRRPAHEAESIGRPTRRRGRLEVLDGLRLLAALAVVAFHFVASDRGAWGSPTNTLFGPLFHAGVYGFLGVELFFMISGFVICMSSWGRTVGEFFVSRIVRLFPAYWAAIVITTVVLTFFPEFTKHLPWSQVFADLTMNELNLHAAYVDPSYWTLMVELNFYVLFAVVVVRRGVTYERTLAFCAGWLFVAAMAGSVNWPLASILFVSQAAPYFVAGIVLHLIHRFGPNLLLWTVLAFSWMFALYRVDSPYRLGGVTPDGVHLHWWKAAAIISVFYLILTLIALGKLSWIRGRWLVVAGSLTYPLYLLHQQIGLTAIDILHNRVRPAILLPSVVAVLLVAAWLVHVIVERPLAGPFKRGLLKGLHAGRDRLVAGARMPSQWDLGSGSDPVGGRPNAWVMSGAEPDQHATNHEQEQLFDRAEIVTERRSAKMGDARP